MMQMILKPIGIIHSEFTKAEGTPAQPCFAQGHEGSVEVFPEYLPGLEDLKEFDRIWLLYWFDRAAKQQLKVTPFMDETAHGVFATRAPCRPNPIGMSCVRLLGAEGDRLLVSEVDILDGTPLVDIKPYVPRFDQYAVERCGWLDKDSVRKATRIVADNRFAR